MALAPTNVCHLQLHTINTTRKEGPFGPGTCHRPLPLNSSPRAELNSSQGIQAYHYSMLVTSGSSSTKTIESMVLVELEPLLTTWNPWFLTTRALPRLHAATFTAPVATRRLGPGSSAGLHSSKARQAFHRTSRQSCGSTRRHRGGRGGCTTAAPSSTPVNWDEGG